ncbi:THUMP domain-containing protein 2 isoform X2 [Oenanthe melanoleuca]|uniref:THUMP domain-containing protein 2 isoform X2 n=1 Tax=Oenanthe melanoleuca TaxID=2939378 RepID=UPI0024C13C65|nr:THUMP domain-containing protein 2 isoform X2 [Oenanthe melanoleuca]
MAPAESGRFFCTAGRGLEPFLAREVRARLGATEVDCVSGKVFFRAAAGLGELRRLRSGERPFLLLKKHGPLPVSGSRGKMLQEIKSLVIEEPKYWLDIISVWRKLHGDQGRTGDVSQENALGLKRKSEEETNTASKRQKMEQVRAIVSEECQVEVGETCVAPERLSSQECWIESKTSSEFPSKGSGENPAVNEKLGFSFRVSCRCSGAIAKTLTSQIFVHLNDIHSVVGIPLFRLPLANREYIKTAGLRSTVAWAMASLAEISAGALVLDPMCGLGTILLEAAKEWPEACYWGADISDSQLDGADGNIRSAGLMDKIELLKASVKALPLPSESFDSVISDIPFGKKFKTTNDAQLLPDILQEMERVLRVGGTLVLLLSQELRRCVEGLTRCAGGDPAAAPGVDGNSSSSTQGRGESLLSRRFGSLVPEGVYAVSLGKTDAFIHKYRKVSAAGSGELSGPGPGPKGT